MGLKEILLLLPILLLALAWTDGSASTASSASPSPVPSLVPSASASSPQVAASPSASSVPPVALHQPKIEALLKPQVYERVVKKRDVMTHAVLDDFTQDPHARVVPYPAPLPSSSASPSPPLELKKYTYYSAMLVHATPTRARQVLTNYSLYSKLVPYVQKSDFNSQTQTLEIVGGVLGWTLHSWIHFVERSRSWIHFEVVGGHFQGMNGEIIFEPYDDSNTLVYLGGFQVLSQWPPKFILENGEEIVFGFTSTRMRSYIESPEPAPSGTQGKANNDGLPQPRSHL